MGHPLGRRVMQVSYYGGVAQRRRQWSVKPRHWKRASSSLASTTFHMMSHDGFMNVCQKCIHCIHHAVPCGEEPGILTHLEVS